MKNPYPEFQALTNVTLRNDKHTLWQEGYDACQEEATALYGKLEDEYKAKDQDLYEGSGDTHAQALCSAIEKLMDEGVR